MKDSLYRNQGDGSFVAISNGSPVAEYGNSVTAMWADLNNDGFLDLVVANGMVTGLGETGDLVCLYQNNTNENHWIRVQCVGAAGSEAVYGRRQPLSNRSGVGAKVFVKAHYRGEDRWQMREINGGSGCYHVSPLEAHFGLGDAETIETVRIEWPSQVVQELHNVAVNQILSIPEQPPGLWLVQPRMADGRFHFTLRGEAGASCRIEGSSDLETWNLVETVIASLDGVPVEIPMDAGGSVRFVRAVKE